MLALRSVIFNIYETLLANILYYSGILLVFCYASCGVNIRFNLLTRVVLNDIPNSHKQFIIYYFFNLFIFIIYYLLFIIYHLLFIIYYLLFII